jgi:hypothetical protein
MTEEIMKCPNCKNPINDNATFCEWCDSHINRSMVNNSSLEIDGLLTFSNYDFTFSYPKNFEIKNDSDENIIDIMCCKKNENEPESFEIVIDKNDSRSPEEVLIELMENSKRYSSIYNTTFNGINCIAVDYNENGLLLKQFSTYYSFNNNKGSFFIEKRSDTKEKLNKEFLVIEQSFKII